MQQRIAGFNWGDRLNYGDKPDRPERPPHKHERFKYRMLTFLEQNLLGGKQIGGFRNYELLKR